MNENNPYGVKVGQVWEDNDSRSNRTVTVLRIVGDYAHVIASTGRRSTIRLDRFKRTSTGYFLVQSGKHK